QAGIARDVRRYLGFMVLARGVEQLARWVWRFHFRIPEFAYCVVLLASIPMTVLLAAGSSQTLVGAAVSVIVFAGVLRWHWDRRRCRAALVVCRFHEGGGTQGHADEAQRIVLHSLRTKLPPRLESAVQPVPVIVGSDERKFA